MPLDRPVPVLAAQLGREDSAPALLSDEQRQRMRERLALAHKARRVAERSGDLAYRAREGRDDTPQPWLS
eukprot:5745760-Prymnesium_polylepis.1